MIHVQFLSDESVLRFYENIRQQVAADMRLESRYRLMGVSAKQQAERLREEMTRRRMRFTPIEWPR
jgi:hypothetical protein